MTSPAPVHVGIYARRSADDDKAGRSVGEQEALGRGDAGELGWAVADVYTDDGRSASRFARKIRDDWQRLTADIRAARLGALWLWESDRGSRELEDWAGLLNLCRRSGVLVHVHTHHRTYDPRVGRDWRSLAEDGIDSAYLSEKISVNTRRGQAGAAADGRPHGKVPYGYRRVWESNPATGERKFVAEEIDPHEGGAIREAADRVLALESLRSVCRDFTARQIPTATGSAWTPNSLRSILLAPRNAGDRVYNGKVVGPGKWEPLLDRDTFDRLRALLRDPSRGSAQSTEARHLISVIATCGRGDCDRVIVAGRYRNSPIYRCQYGHVVRQQAPVDAFVREVTRRVLSSPEFAPAVAGSDDERTRTLREHVVTLQARLDLAVDDYSEARIDHRRMLRITAKLQPQIAAAEAEIESYRSTDLLGRYAGPSGADRWDAAPISTQRAVLALLFDIRLLPTGRGRRVFDPASVEITPKWSAMGH